MSSEKNPINPIKIKKKKGIFFKIKLTIIIILSVLLVAGLVIFFSSASVERSFKSCQSDISGGLYREVNVYTPTGELIAHYEGKIDIEENESGGKVLFDLDGKRYIYYNCLVEVIEIDNPNA